MCTITGARRLGSSRRPLRASRSLLRRRQMPASGTGPDRFGVRRDAVRPWSGGWGCKGDCLPDIRAPPTAEGHHSSDRRSSAARTAAERRIKCIHRGHSFRCSHTHGHRCRNCSHLFEAPAGQMASLWLFTCARAMGAPTVMRWTPAGSLGGKWQMVTLGPGDASATSPGDKPTGIEHGIW